MGGSDKDEDWEAIIWVDEYCRVLIQISTHTCISSSSSENENWEKEFSLLVQQEELEAFLGVHDDLWNAPSPSHQPHRNIFLSLASIQPHVDWVEDYMSHMESSCKNIYAHDQWKVDKKANCQEKLLRKISCIILYLWRNPHNWIDSCIL